jgi:hypothetical protein
VEDGGTGGQHFGPGADDGGRGDWADSTIHFHFAGCAELGNHLLQGANFLD